MPKAHILQFNLLLDVGGLKPETRLLHIMIWFSGNMVRVQTVKHEWTAFWKLVGFCVCSLFLLLVTEYYVNGQI